MAEEIRQVPIEELIKLEVPGSDTWEKRQSWEGADSVRVGDWIVPDDEGHRDFDELEKRATDFNKWFLGPENLDMEAKIRLIAAPVTQTGVIGDDEKEIVTLGWGLAVVPIERGLRGEEWGDGELFLKAQQIVEKYWDHVAQGIKITG